MSAGTKVGTAAAQVASVASDAAASSTALLVQVEYTVRKVRERECLMPTCRQLE